MYETLLSKQTEIIEVLHMLIGYLPNTIHTSNIGICKECGKATPSGQLHYCPKCAFIGAKKLVKELEQARQQRIEENEKWFKEITKLLNYSVEQALKKPSVERAMAQLVKEMNRCKQDV